MEQIIIQITSGRGPAECCRVVARLQEKIIKQAKALKINIKVLSATRGDLNGTLSSTVLLAEGDKVNVLTKEWEGTVQWIAQSPYRKFHKRKNWFAGISISNVQSTQQWEERDVTFETCRSSGPGGQHVNKTETAVRGVHRPTGLQVVASDSRSQWQNKKLCLERLKEKFLLAQANLLLSQQQDQWQEHNELVRGEAVKVIREEL
ncbi:peptide chain release factor H [Chitinophaga silvatica]|uniref:Peptide chain release factor H n=1 Tax=Chitinophaga silvatica TaxID=2282649 RepID=A0A3E1Y4T7_9BACT|nr:peptide chain release factor H [Chitinophaga silvatica]RFS19656.1 peptide chain release factor H [Chitinophaga silvatica]